MNEDGRLMNNKIQLNDMEVLFPNQDEYKTADREMLIADLKDKDRLIEKLWFELKETREELQLLKG